MIKIIVHEGDLPSSVKLGKEIAIDTEAMGLDNKRDRLCLVQLTDGNGQVHLIKFAKDKYDAPNLINILTSRDHLKLFHFARFDVAIMKQYLGVMTENIYCTKTASKLARTYSGEHGLRSIVRELIGQEINKTVQSSYWGSEDLTVAQQNYAANDVIYLHELKSKLDEILVKEGRKELAEASFKLIPAICELDLAGWNGALLFEH